MRAANDPSPTGPMRIPGEPSRALTFASATLVAGFIAVAFFAPELLGGFAFGTLSGLDLLLLAIILVGVVGLLYLAGRSVVEIGPEQIVVRRPFRTTHVPWESLIRYQCDPAFREMSLFFVARDRRGRPYASFATVTERQARAILADPRSEWVPVEGRFELILRTPAA